MKTCLLFALLLFTSAAWTQDAPKKYPWQSNGTNCDKNLTFCWYGADLVSDPEVTAHGQRWVTTDKDEKPFEWVTEVRCVQVLHTCIVARNQKVVLDNSAEHDATQQRILETAGR